MFIFLPQNFSSCFEDFMKTDLPQLLTHDQRPYLNTQY